MSCITRNKENKITGIVLDNGQDSKLFDELLAIHKHDMTAYNLYQQTLSPAFQLSKHDFTLDSNGEPVIKNKQANSNRIEAYLVESNISNLSTNDIYSKLGNKTQSENVTIVSNPLQTAQTYGGIAAFRNSKDPNHWGNPFASESTTTKSKFDLINKGSVKESVKAFIDWLTTDKYKDIEPERRQELIKQLKSGELKGEPIYYYKELKEPSHATALDYLINKYNWNNKIIPEEKPSFNKQPIKQGVEELFESDPELANAVYKALGFKNKLKTSLGKELEYKDPYVSKSRLKNFKKYEVLDENNKNIGTVVIEYRGDKSVILHPKLNVIGKGYGKDLYKIVASTFDVEIQEWSEGLIDNSISAKKMWDSLEKEGVAKRVFDTEQGDNFRVLKINSQITPQQKQQALQLYSQYLDTIFPDSQVKDIVYHGSDSKKEKFSSTGAGTHFGTLKAAKERRNKTIIPVVLNIDKPVLFKDILADDVLKAAHKFLKENGEYLENGYRNEESGLLVYLYNQGKIDSDTLWDGLYSNRNTMLQILQDALNSNGYRYINEVEDKGSTSYVVFEPEQIHILGGKQDIEGFKEFVSKETKKVDKDLNQPEKPTSDIWSQNKEAITSKFPDITEDQFNQMTEQEKTKFIECYL